LGEKMTKATPATPVMIDGLSDTPAAGDIFREVKTLDEARNEVRQFELHARAKKFMNPGIQAQGKSLNLIIKADVQGSLEAIEQALDELKSRTAEVQLNIIDKGVGEINESDVLRAESTAATIIGFNAKATASTLNLAKSKGVTIDVYDIIYELLEDVTKVLVSMLSPEVVRTTVGTAKILAVFRTEEKTQIVGGRVEDGKITDKSSFYIKRKGEQVGEGKIEELQTGKQEVDMVQTGSEFGISVQLASGKIEKDDVLEIYTEEVKARKLS